MEIEDDKTKILPAVQAEVRLPERGGTMKKVIWLIIFSVLAVLALFSLLASFCKEFFLRLLGCWLVIDSVGSICLRHKDLGRYYEPRRGLELFYRLVRLCWGLGLVLFGV